MVVAQGFTESPGWMAKAEVEADRGVQEVITPNRLKGMSAKPELSSKEGKKSGKFVEGDFSPDSRAHV